MTKYNARLHREKEARLTEVEEEKFKLRNR